MTIQEDVLAALLAAQGESLSGSRLADKLHFSRNAVWKAVRVLREQGYAIEAITNRGYRLVSAPDRLTAAAIRDSLHTRVFGRQLRVEDCLPSTNTTARELAAAGAPEGTAVVAGQQSAGRGRRGRAFFSPADSGIYMSFVLLPRVAAADAGLITSCAAVAVARAIERLSSLPVQIKWVNDLFIHGKKVCGILTEAGLNLETGELDYAVVGIGINVRAITFPEELQPIATSLENEGAKVPRSALAAEILNQWETAYAAMDTGDFLEESRRRSLVLGRCVTVTRGNESYPAIALSIDDKGQLVVRAGKEIRTLSSGEVSIRL